MTTSLFEQFAAALEQARAHRKELCDNYGEIAAKAAWDNVSYTWADDTEKEMAERSR